MTPQELKEIEARANEATEGPWGQHDYDNDHCMITAGVDGNGAYIYVADVWDERDIPFIAHARSDIPNLLAHIAALTEKLRAVETERDEARKKLRVEEEGHAQLQVRCYEGFPSASDGIFDELSALRAELERKDAALKDVELAFEEARDCVLNERHELAEQGTTNDSINSVLAILDRTVGAALQPKEPPCQKA